MRSGRSTSTCSRLPSPGPVHARRIETQDLGRQVAIDEPRIVGGWQPMNGGYRVELRIPLSMLGARLGVLVDERARRGADPVSIGTLDHDSLAPQGRLLIPSPELSNYLAQFVQPGLRLTVIGSRPGGAQPGGRPVRGHRRGAERGLLPQLYRRMLERPDDRKVVEAQAPIAAPGSAPDAGLGADPGNRRALADAARQGAHPAAGFHPHHQRLVVILMFTFAAWLAWRLAAAAPASETALTREGLVITFPETSAADELGDVARSFSMLLGRLNEYTGLPADPGRASSRTRSVRR